MHVCKYPQRSEETIRSFGTEVKGSWETTDMGTGNQTQGLYMNTKDF